MDFAFLIHSRDYRDVERKFKIAKILPRKLIEYWCLHWPPVLVSRITGLKDKEGKECKGYIVGIPMTAKQMMENRELAQKRVVEAVRKAEKLGAQIVGLGALTSSVTGGGELIKDKINIQITSGHAYTSHIVSSYVLKAINDFSLDMGSIHLAVVGAAGSIGSTCSQYLAAKGIKNILLIDSERKAYKLNNLVFKLKEINPSIKLEHSHVINKIKLSDIIIAATNSPEAVIEPGDLKPGAIIVDDAQPSDISLEVIKQRDDVLVVDGGVVRTKDINVNFNMGLACKNDIFSCLGEVLLFAWNNEAISYQIGNIDYRTIAKIGSKGLGLDFEVSCFQRCGRLYDKSSVDKIKNVIVRNKKNKWI